FGQTVSSQTVLGADVYQTRCAQCHENAAASRAPSRDTLQKMTASRILRTLDFGLMMGVAYPLTREERQAVAGFLGTKGSEPGPAASAFCSAERHPLSAETAGHWNGWSPLPANTGCLHWTFQANGQVRYAIAAVANASGSDYSLLFGDQIGWFYSLEAKSGQLLWKHRIDDHEGTRLTGSPEVYAGVAFIGAAS